MNDEQLLRYSRHILLDEIGIDGQERLNNAHALVIGAGGLGSPVALYLASAGIGTLTICDGDVVDLTNLQRQIVHRVAAVGNTETPLVAALHEPVDAFVVECSSFRLAWVESFRAEASAWLNLAPDHLNWHRSLDAYVAAKARTNSAPSSSSSRGSRRGSISTMVTSLPKRWKIEANSQPMAPPPITTAEEGRRSIESTSSEVVTSRPSTSKPGIVRGTDPAASR